MERGAAGLFFCGRSGCGLLRDNPHPGPPSQTVATTVLARSTWSEAPAGVGPSSFPTPLLVPDATGRFARLPKLGSLPFRPKGPLTGLCLAVLPGVDGGRLPAARCGTVRCLRRLPPYSLNNGRRFFQVRALSALPRGQTGPVGAVTLYSGTTPARGHGWRPQEAVSLELPSAPGGRTSHGFVSPGAVHCR